MGLCGSVGGRKAQNGEDSSACVLVLRVIFISKKLPVARITERQRRRGKNKEDRERGKERY